MAWIVRLVKVGAEGDERGADVMRIDRPGGLGTIADLGLTLAEAKVLLASLQREIVVAQAEEHATQRPDCRRCGGHCRVKDYRSHAVAALFGQVVVRLPRFCCAECGGTKAAVGWRHRIAVRPRNWIGCGRISVRSRPIGWLPTCWANSSRLTQEKTPRLCAVTQWMLARHCGVKVRDRRRQRRRGSR